ncbi:hypothetical protein ABLO26_26815 [Neobacillus sp. 179-J 1A1 HS]
MQIEGGNLQVKGSIWQVRRWSIEQVTRKATFGYDSMLNLECNIHI